MYVCMYVGVCVCVCVCYEPGSLLILAMLRCPNRLYFYSCKAIIYFTDRSPYVILLLKKINWLNVIEWHLWSNSHVVLEPFVSE